MAYTPDNLTSFVVLTLRFRDLQHEVPINVRQTREYVPTYSRAPIQKDDQSPA